MKVAVCGNCRQNVPVTEDSTANYAVFMEHKKACRAPSVDAHRAELLARWKLQQQIGSAKRPWWMFWKGKTV